MRLFRTLQSLTAEQQLNTNQYIASKFIPLLQGKLFQDATCNGLISFTLFQKRQWRIGYVSLILCSFSLVSLFNNGVKNLLGAVLEQYQV